MHFKELFDNCHFFIDNKIFPYVKLINSFALIGINTINYYSRVINPFASNGKIYKEQFDAIEKILSGELIKSKRKIILSHYHYYKNKEGATSSSSFWNKIESYTLKLRGKKKIIKLFAENNIELVLHGHSHEIRDYVRKGVRFINAGGTIDNAFTKDSSLIIIAAEEKIDAEITPLKLNSIPKGNVYSDTEYQPSLAG